MAVPPEQEAAAKVAWLNKKNMKYLLIFMILLTGQSIWSQEPFAPVLERYNRNLIPYISVTEAAVFQNTQMAYFLDARSREEFDVSHISGAYFIGEKPLAQSELDKIITDPDRPIVVYCSIGVRSETSGAQIKALGFPHLLNLYGGIFEWKNTQHPVVNTHQNQTDSIHTYNKRWSVYLGQGIKIYE